ncbi:hypothetical protein QJU89_05925 [Pasteurella skyensis]|uniref:Uncharacterized protein n=1 Tax=Phocoenobacter skyensis TaxID=97481 RepID=A0AAJ6N9A6_9PAST|nr:hypothetical protein [Pasteurella skyensis]MDP8162829.1 hypothetical protein [Pasteurella skyensis]MDP8172584.1 hypothetical protein [Pasteurella skyensis]MDP8179084.1 hypothetical protein [Pasteurella skyensis]MDP8183231.1 hypothetical protein [Pasteurella skyensis]MDP8189282.1 hypothetical protein [Pasteurella skyensis]
MKKFIAKICVWYLNLYWNSAEFKQAEAEKERAEALKNKPNFANRK